MNMGISAESDTSEIFHHHFSKTHILLLELIISSFASSITSDVVVEGTPAMKGYRYGIRTKHYLHLYIYFY